MATVTLEQYWHSEPKSFSINSYSAYGIVHVLVFCRTSVSPNDQISVAGALTKPNPSQSTPPSTRKTKKAHFKKREFKTEVKQWSEMMSICFLMEII